MILRRRFLSYGEARDFYDGWGKRQDSQAHYEDEPVRRMVEQAGFGDARRVLEVGCGTGRFARRLLEEHLRQEASYLGLDLSPTMLDLSRRKLAPFGGRAALVRTDGSPRFPVRDGVCDRIVANYLLDLLSESDIHAFLEESFRVAAPEGRVCLVNLTHGPTVSSGLASRLWSAVHRLAPRRVGGCRPLDVRPFLKGGRWRVLFEEVVVSSRLASQVLVAVPAKLADNL